MPIIDETQLRAGVRVAPRALSVQASAGLYQMGNFERELNPLAHAIVDVKLRYLPGMDSGLGKQRRDCDVDFPNLRSGRSGIVLAIGATDAARWVA